MGQSTSMWPTLSPCSSTNVLRKRIRGYIIFWKNKGVLSFAQTHDWLLGICRGRRVYHCGLSRDHSTGKHPPHRAVIVNLFCYNHFVTALREPDQTVIKIWDSILSFGQSSRVRWMSICDLIVVFVDLGSTRTDTVACGYFGICAGAEKKRQPALHGTYVSSH